MSAVPTRSPGPRRWLSALVLGVAGVFASLTLIHLAQQRMAADDAGVIEQLRQASDDLDLGLLHLALAGMPGSPWQQAQGLALLEQGVQALAAVSGAVALGEAGDGLRQSLDGLRSAVQADPGLAVLGDPRMLAATHAAHTRARAVEQALRLRAAARARWLDQAFAWTLAVSLALLAALAHGFLRSVRAREQALAAAAERDAQLAQTLSALHEGVLAFDALGTPTRVNPAAQQLLGLDLAQLQALHRQGQGWGPVAGEAGALAPSDLPPAQVLATGQPLRLPALTIHRPGEAPRVVEVNAVPLREAATGALSGVVASLRDVTAERQAAAELVEHRFQLEAQVRERTAALRAALAAQRESDDFVRAIADHQDSLTAYYDATLTLRFANRAYLDWMGLTRAQALGRPMHEVLGAETAQRRRGSAERILAGESILEPQVVFAGGGGRVGHFRIHRAPDVRDGVVRGYYLTATNISDTVAAGERLERMNQALTVARDRAESATRAKSMFLAHMSHEIRTPMNAIVGLTRLMQRRAAPHEIPRQIDKVAEAAEHLLRLLNDILDLSKIEAGQFHLERVPFDGEALVRRAVALVAPAAQARQLALDVALPIPLPRLVGDPTRLSQALLNLLGNAVKFTDQGGVRLTVTATPEGDGALLLRFEVQDSGIGVDDQTLARLFQPFRQADDTMARRYGGTGLGLTITREIALRMGGEAGGRGQPGVGSTFWFSARLGVHDTAAAPPPALAAPGDRRTLRGCRVLLAEDNPVNQEVAAALLQEFGATVTLAADGAQAVARAASADVDIVLMDMQMPGMDGLEATRRIRRLPRGAQVPIIAMTANAFEDDRQRCLAAGMNDHLVKPVDPGALQQALLRWFGGGAGVADAPLAVAVDAH